MSKAPSPDEARRQRFALLLEYEGTAFRGWQKQGEAGIRTVQGVLLARAAEVFGRPDCELQGNGRTDAGVHALAYTAHLEVVTALTAPEIRAALNQQLPKDLAIRDVWPVDSRFHARHHCLGRSYLYQIAEGQRAFVKRYAWSPEEGLDLSLMEETAALFVGMHDFAAFAERQEMKHSTQVLIDTVTLQRRDGLLLIRVVASHFLWHLVRRLVGTLVAVGSGRLTIDEVKAMLAGGQSLAPPWMAPAHGLFFERAFYEREAYRSFAATVPLTPAPRWE